MPGHSLTRPVSRAVLKMHKGDGARLAVADGQRVRLKSRVWATEVEVELSDEMMPGVVSLPHGWGHAREGTLLRTAQRHAGASISDITDERAIDGLSGNAAFSGTPVEVELLDGAADSGGTVGGGNREKSETGPASRRLGIGYNGFA